MNVCFRFLALGLLLSGTAHAFEPVTIENDPGRGPIARYERLAGYYHLHDTPIRIKGFCAAACTLFLSIGGRRACTYPDTVILFSPVSAENVGTLVGNSPDLQQHIIDLATWRLLNSYPLDVRSWIAESGGLSILRPVVLYGAELRKMFPVCVVNGHSYMAMR
jgi:hypothetical protein